MMDDPFVELLESNAQIASWLENQALDEESISERIRQRVPDIDFCVTGEFSRPLFHVPVALDALPSDQQIHTMLEDMSIVPKAPRKSQGALVPSPCPTDSASGFYIVSEETSDGWGLGPSIGSDMRPIGLAVMMGYEPCDGLRLRAARILASKRTGEVFEVLLLKDGRVLVLHNSCMTTRYSVRMYGPRQPNGRWGKVLRSMHMTSLLDCARCCRRKGARSSSFCRCAQPVLPTATKPFQSWNDFLQMHTERVEDTVQLQTVLSGSGQLLASFVLYQPQSIVRTSADALPLFQALVLNNDQFQAQIQMPVFLSGGTETVALYDDADAFDSGVVPEGRLLLGSGDAETKALELDTERETSNATASSAGGEERGSENQTGTECDMCGKSFKTRFNLRRHVQMVHTQERSHQCKECSALFKLKSHLKAHVEQVHSAEKSQVCPLCSKRFWSASNLKRHVDEAHLKLRAFTCEHCPKSFSSKYNLDRHVVTTHEKGSHQNVPSRFELL